MPGEEKTSVTVDLGDQQETLEERMATGRYASPSEVVQEALQALEREDALIGELMEDKLEGVMDEPGTEAQVASTDTTPASTTGRSRVGP